MNTGLKRLILLLAITIVLPGFLTVDIKAALSQSTGARIDIFTQKEPHSGRGLNASSDAFGPDEEVIIYANVTFNDYPEVSVPVAFEVNGPKNPLKNITLYDSAETNNSGFAEIRFRTGLNNLTNFGEWVAVGSVRIADIFVQDFLYFRVGWIVEIKSIKTINENHIERTKFFKEGSVGIELSLLSIAMTKKTATIAITIYDKSNVTINSREIDNFTVPANSTLVYTSYFLSIPESAASGEAVVDACAYTAPISDKGVPYCPKVSKHFWIVTRDIAILDARPSSDSVFKGEVVNIRVIVKNNGEEVESFNVSTYTNKTLVDTLPVTDLGPSMNTTMSFVWNTSLATEGRYRISASAPLQYDVTPWDNTFVDGFVQVKTRPLIPIHDVAVLSVVPSSSLVYIGDVLNVNVTVKNKGSVTESFNITLYYNSSTVGILRVDNLAVGSEYTLTFQWNTSAVSEGNYTMSAYASLSNDINVLDNTLVDGIVQVKAKPPPAIKWYTLTIIVTAGGTTDPAPGSYNYISGATVEVEAIPSTNYTLNHWELDNISVGPVSPYRVLMDGNHTLKAVFSVAPTLLLIPEMLLLSLLIGLAVLVGVGVIFAFVFGLWWCRRKRKKRRSIQLNSRRVGFQRTKTCSACGKQFNGVHTFCPYCFTFHGKDYQ